MSDVIVKPFEEQLVSRTIPVTYSSLDLTKYFERSNINDSSAEYENTMAKDGVGEVLNFKSFRTERTSISEKLLKHTAYGRRSRKGYQFVVRHEYMERHTTPEGRVYDEPVCIYVACKTTDGSSMKTGSQWAEAINRTVLTLVEPNADDSGFDPKYSKLELLIRGFARVLR